MVSTGMRGHGAMGQQLTLELSEAEYRALERRAGENGTSPVEWAADRLREQLAMESDEELAQQVHPELVEGLRRIAARDGRPYVEVAAAFMRATAPQPLPKVSAVEAKAAMERFLQCTVSLGHATGSDNESIDADLATEYADNHECLDAPNKRRPRE